MLLFWIQVNDSAQLSSVGFQVLAATQSGVLCSILPTSYRDQTFTIQISVQSSEQCNFRNIVAWRHFGRKKFVVPFLNPDITQNQFFFHPLVNFEYQENSCMKTYFLIIGFRTISSFSNWSECFYSQDTQSFIQLELCQNCNTSRSCGRQFRISVINVAYFICHLFYRQHCRCRQTGMDI